MSPPPSAPHSDDNATHVFHYHLDNLLSSDIDFVLYGNTTANAVIKNVVKALDGGPNGMSGDAAAALALSTPIVLFLCVIFMSRCRRVVCCGGMCVCCWFNCTGACKHICGGETLLSGTEPATGLEPDEDVNDPDHIMGDEDHDNEVLRDPEIAHTSKGARPPSSASEASDDEERAGSPFSSYDRGCKQCCDTVAACLENKEDHQNGNGSRGPASEVVSSSKKNGKKK